MGHGTEYQDARRLVANRPGLGRLNLNQQASKISPMVRYTLVAALIQLTGQAVSIFSPGSIFGVLKDIGNLALSVSVVYFLFKTLRWLKRKLFWKVRNKIIISFAFVGILPVAILLLIGWFQATLIFGQLTAFYLENELQSISNILEQINHRIVLSYYERIGEKTAALPLLLSQGTKELEELPSGLSRACLLTFQAQGSASSTNSGIFRLASVIPPNPKFEVAFGQQAPEWILEGFDGLTLIAQQLFFTQAVRVASGEGKFLLVLQLPFDEELLGYIKRRTSIEIGMTPLSLSASPSDFQTAHSDFLASQNFLAIKWFHIVSPIEWTSGQAPPEGARAIPLAIPLGTLLSNFFAQSSPQAGQIVPWLLVGLAATFLVVELFSLLIGSAIARSITGSIHNIYAGVQSIQRGNFNYRIAAGNRDQLDAVAQSFNQMSESIGRLLKEVSEKEWLEREIEIAKDVQSLLFPQQTPLIRHLQVAAICIPARRVSGDYYDFIPHDRNHLDIVLGDISGKGISAALLMASLQSTLRGQLLSLDSGTTVSDLRLARAVSRASRQLYQQTPPSAFSTLVVAHFDALRLELTYCNAGHHPPLILSGNQVCKLEQGGTVVGLIENWDYQQQTLPVKSGDLILLYTDGIVEAASEEGEQFGEDRLTRLAVENQFLTAEDIQRLILDEVFHWCGSGEQADDITVMVLKVC